MVASKKEKVNPLKLANDCKHGENSFWQQQCADEDLYGYDDMTWGKMMTMVIMSIVIVMITSLRLARICANGVTI